MKLSLFRRAFPKNVPALKEPVLWVHCASVGEFNTFLPVLKELKRAFSVALTYFSPRAESYLNSKGEFYDFLYPLPLDLPFSLRRFENALKPKALIIVERELWLNLLRATKTKKILVNAYAKGNLIEKRLSRYFKLILTRTQRDEEAFRSYGAKKVKTCGNMKFILEGTQGEVDLNIEAGSKVILGGSTHEGEEELLLKALKRLKGRVNLKLILAPRHMERVDKVSRLAERMGFKASLRSNCKSPGWEVLIVNTLGELRELYKYCDLAVVGGTFVPVGGHNLLEPLLWKKPVIFGKYTHKVRDMEEFLLSTGSGVKIHDESELTEVLLNLINSPPSAVDIKEISEKVKACYIQNILNELK